MKKQNILEILFVEKLKQIAIEEENFNSCIPNFEECITEYIIPFLEVNQKLYSLGFEVDVNSTDELIKKKSLILRIRSEYFSQFIHIISSFLIK